MIAIKENTFEEVETNEWYQILKKDKSKKQQYIFVKTWMNLKV